MQVKDERSELSRGSDWTQEDQNGRKKGKRGTGMADTNICQGHTEVSRTGKLLLLIH